MHISGVDLRGCQFPQQQLTPEEEARFLALRINVVKKYKIIAMAMAGGAVLLIITGIVIVSKSTGGGFPLTAGSPIWAGSLILIGAIFGLALGSSNSEWKTESDKSKQRCLVVVFYVFAVTSFSFMGLCIGYSAWSMAACASRNEENTTCSTSFDLQVGMNAVAIVTAIGLFICCLTVCIMFCYYRKAFLFQSRQERVAQMQLLLQQQQHQIAMLSQSQQQPYYPNTQGMQFSNTGAGYGTTFSHSPPSYSEALYGENKR
ncbi:unnamed protein product [Mytilus coruscus]|uniref:Uncharacterized protein n=1 Tax=Mytilus coruscus TaxID=42192 RepID=A0A6J8EIX4_MYTCO|nr:unnamed protein product [Mytilus coruscus]